MEQRQLRHGGIVVLRQMFMADNQQPIMKYYVYPIEDTPMNARQLDTLLNKTFGVKADQRKLLFEAWEKDVEACEGHFGQDGHFLFIR